MAWHYRDIQTFPAFYAEGMRQAVADLGKPHLLFSDHDRSSLERSCAHFRWFRWCLRQKPEVNVNLGSMESAYQFRISIDFIDGYYLAYLTASPTKISELLTLNPHLSDIVAANCQ